MLMQMNYQGGGGPSKLRFKKNSQDLDDIQVPLPANGAPYGKQNNGGHYKKQNNIESHSSIKK